MSEYRRFFALPSERQGEKILVTSEYNHIAKVLRMRKGENAIVCFNDGIEHFCTIEEITSSCVCFAIEKSNVSENENDFDTTLFVGILKGDKNDLVVQKAVELGVNKIVFFESRYTVAKIDDKKLERLNKISKEASKQCGRAVIAPVEKTTVERIAESSSQFDLPLFCYERETKEMLSSRLHRANKIAFVIGSEGGFSEEEAQMLAESGWQSVSLGKRILRAETVPLYLLSVVDNALCGGEEK